MYVTKSYWEGTCENKSTYVLCITNLVEIAFYYPGVLLTGNISQNISIFDSKYIYLLNIFKYVYINYMSITLSYT